jgi:dihydroorotase
MNPLTSHNSFRMKILLKKARIIDPGGPHDNEVNDLLMEDGYFVRIAHDIAEDADKTIEVAGLHVSPGFVETFADAGDPGFEHRENLTTAAAAAAAGGFTHLFVIPNTRPVMHDKGVVEYVRDKHTGQPVTLHPIGAVTRNTDGKELAEMYDMRSSGAVAFSDGTHPIHSAGLMIKALQYVKSFDGLIIQIPEDRTIAPHGLAHEGIASTRLGLPGRPAIAEELMVARDIALTRYAGSRLHLSSVTLPGSVELIEKARNEGVRVTCSVTPQHLWFCDEDLSDYDTQLKSDPPLRTRADKEALLLAVKSGKIDCISTHHLPQHIDQKQCEFEYAKAGMIGLESAFGVLGALGLVPEEIVRLLSVQPRKIFGLPSGRIEVGQPVDLTCFQPDEIYSFTTDMIASRSRNTPFIGKQLKGRILAAFKG